MRGVLVFCGVFFVSLFGFAHTDKPFVMWEKTKVKAEDSFKKSQSCFLQQHLPQHIDYVLAHVLPRIEREAQVLVQRQYIDGKAFYVADGLNYRDLYHAHIRYPGTYDIQEMSPFLDSNIYHLQYHSFEHLDMMMLSWWRELEVLLAGTIYTSWVNENIEKATQPEQDHYGSGYYLSLPEGPAILPDSDLLSIAQLWHTHLGAQSQGAERLMLRLQMMNDIVGNNRAVRELMFFRSIASFDQAYGVINPGLDLSDYWQPLDIHFESVERNSKIAAEIHNFKSRTGLSWVGNPTSREGDNLGLSGAFREDAQATFDKIIEIAQDDPSPENVFKHTGDNPYFVTLFALSGEMVFLLKYNMSTYCK